MDIGRRIYYELSTGNVVFDTGERSGIAEPTTVDQDFEMQANLQNRVRDTLGIIELEYGQFRQDFSAMLGFTVDPKTEELIFKYPQMYDGETPPESIPEPELLPPLSVSLQQLKERQDAADAAIVMLMDISMMNMM